MIIESGVLSSTATLVAVSVYLADESLTLTAIDSLVQLATMTPLFIIVRVGLGIDRHKTLPSDQTGDTKIEFTPPDPQEIRSTTDPWDEDPQTTSCRCREPPFSN